MPSHHQNQCCFIFSGTRAHCVNSLWLSEAIWRNNLGQHWLNQSLVSWRHQATTWTNVDSSSERPNGTHLRAIPQEVPQPSITEISLKFAYLKVCQNLPEATELTSVTTNIESCTLFVQSSIKSVLLSGPFWHHMIQHRFLEKCAFWQHKPIPYLRTNLSNRTQPITTRHNYKQYFGYQLLKYAWNYIHLNYSHSSKGVKGSKIE